MSTRSPALPTEIWSYVLKEAITLEWREDMFFPPLEDFSQIAGFKAACKAFYDLVVKLAEPAHRRSLCIIDVRKVINMDVDVERIRELRIECSVTIAEFQHFIPRCSRLVSLSSSLIKDIFCPLGQHAILASKNLVRLDLTYAIIWNSAPSLDFPNLRALRLASERPLVRRDNPKHIPYFLAARQFATKITNTVSKLDRLKHLSVHISLADNGIISEIQENHLDRHRCAFASPPIPFKRCEFCTRIYTDAHEKLIRAREAKLTLMLAEQLKELESVKWMDKWNESFYDEQGLRESRIVRKSDGKVSIFIDGEKAPLAM